MAQKKTPPKPAPVDPLADLREDDAAGPPEGLAIGENVAAEPETQAVEVRPMVTPETHAQMVAETVAAWHQDPTALGFLHGGGSMCGCRYIARLAIQAAVPVMTEEDQEEKELAPSE